MSGGLDRALDSLKELDLGCGQIFTSNQRRWAGRHVTDVEIERYSRRTIPVLSHASYLINLASSSPGVSRRSFIALEEELLRMHSLGISWTVLHPGAHLGAGEEAALLSISTAVREVLKNSHPSTGILFENTAGQGTTVGFSFRQISMLLERTAMPERTGVCFDTCHAHAAGYDLSSAGAADDVMAEFDAVTGIGRIRAFHMNDCLGDCGSHRDRHARIGDGLIGTAPLLHLASLEEFRDVPGIVETPGSDSDRAADARTLTV
ncbi:MAG: deoxyribonuclease IV [Candidatus Fermentibacteraceae bacterium]|nr:deoxyribonuclease IV [Candidatus Fermentibacteraceae bacterium]